MLALMSEWVKRASHRATSRYFSYRHRLYDGSMETTSSSTGDGAAATTFSLAAVTALADESRRRMYAFIRAARRPVTREEAAASVGISRKLAAFHLDKLVEVGLLHYRFGGGGPARVGRRPKVYEPADTDIQVSIPARRH